MSFPLLHARRAALALLVLGASMTASPADRIHLEGGGMIETGSWRIEDDLLVYESAGGSVGIPRSIVVEIEEVEGGQAQAPVPADTREPPSPSPATVGSPVARLYEGKAAFDRRDFYEAAAIFRGVMDRADARYPDARVYYVLSEMALGEDAMAFGAVQDGLARDPNQPQLLELLGELRNREERVEAALRAWQQAYDLDPTDRLREKILKAQRELAAGRDYETDTSSHFNLRYDGDVPPELSDSVLEHLEEQYWVIADAVDHSPRQPITVLLYPKKEFRDVTQSPDWVGGLYDGKIRVPLGGLTRLNPVARSVLLHELTHAFVHSKTRGNCPRWLHEGLAQIMEERHLSRADRQDVAARLAEGDPATWESRGFTYPMALSLARYIESRRGFHGLVRLLEYLSDGHEIDSALRSVYSEDHAALCRAWARQARSEGGP